MKIVDWMKVEQRMIVEQSVKVVAWMKVEQ